MRGGPTFDHERFSINVARMKKGGENFEVVVDPDLAVDMRNGQDVDLHELLHAEKIWSDAKKGELASETHMQSVFGTTDALEVAKVLIMEGEIQLTKEHRDRLQQARYNRIVSHIHMNAINPVTDTVHTEERIRRAMEEARVRVDAIKPIEQQLPDIIKKLQPIIPLKFSTFLADVHLTAEYAAKCYGTLQNFGNIRKEEWLSDGSLAATIELPAGKYTDLVNNLSAKTQGNVQITKKKE